jgi:DNA replication protein DnaC
MKNKLTNLCGKVREITDNKIVGDDGKDIDVLKKQPINVSIKFINNPSISAKITTLEDSVDKLVSDLMLDLKTEFRYINSTIQNYDFEKTNLSVDKFRFKITDFIDSIMFENKLSSMIICGKDSFGCGKTHLIHAIGKYLYTSPKVELKTNQYGEIYMTYAGAGYQIIREEDLIHRILATYKNNTKEYENDIYEELDKYDILAIDDIGKYAPTNLEFYRRVMFQIIDTRYNRKKGVILSSNFGLSELTKFLGVAISDRLNEMSKGFQIEIKGLSNRVK